MARGVGEDERPPRGREEPIGDVDRDALLALGAQPVGDCCEIHRSPARDVVDVIGEQRARVEQEAPDQGALAVIDRSRSRESQQLTMAGQLGGPHQKYPSRFRSSIAASEVRSSALVSPRSDTVAASVSAITDGMSAASDRTAPVTVMSPTVR